MDTNETYHVPVLLQQSVDALIVDPGGVYVDATFGGGGHSHKIVSRLKETGHLYGFDQDSDTMRNIVQDSRFTFVYSNFRYMRNFLRYYNVERVDGIIADLGVSWHHFDNSTRGFSFRFDGPIDMRMNQSGGMSAVDVINNYSEQALANILYMYGELRNSRKIASAIVKNREASIINTTGQLQEIIMPVIGRERIKKDLAKIYQALRIEVNQEIAALCEMLSDSVELLKPGGRLVVITYHSIEDRIVKNIMRSGNVDGKIEKDFFGNRKVPFKVLGKPLVPDVTELNKNPRSRSAKLRIAEKFY
ncbi:MAG TPA: 16S rRNA (cytosine(1402)-N(4))-methyltransferase RsmH [Bacteroidaceae bacterium]|nr:16S rRNA (cytosine(1402)-N(4))-methyltransferase RsmH [Bacteroidaceae bacterium]